MAKSGVLYLKEAFLTLKEAQGECRKYVVGTVAESVVSDNYELCDRIA
jgi:hypothetical protein